MRSECHTNLASELIYKSKIDLFTKPVQNQCWVFNIFNWI